MYDIYRKLEAESNRKLIEINKKSRALHLRSLTVSRVEVVFRRFAVPFRHRGREGREGEGEGG